MAQASTPESAGSARPFKYYGKQGEFTLLAPLKREPGVAERVRAIAGRAQGTGLALVGTLHDIRVALIDNDTRLLFATTYDGDWDQYIDDFVANPETSAILDELFVDLEGFPGWQSPEVQDCLEAVSKPLRCYACPHGSRTGERQALGDHPAIFATRTLEG
jgi:hypothetical protein